MGGNIRDKVKEFYGEIASKVEQNVDCSCCSGSSCCAPISSTALPLYDEDSIANLPHEAISASLGCANPLAIADLREGETVLDLGCGGGIDVLAASKYVGQSGKVYGLDMTDEMLELANRNRERMGATNVEFLKGYIEEIPLGDAAVDVVMSNCVINLSTDKKKVLEEAYRVLKPGGRLAIADIVSVKEVPTRIRQAARMWMSCIAGALDVGEYEQILVNAGFRDIEIQPVVYYTRQTLEQLLDSKPEHISESDLRMADGAFASAWVKAVK